MKLTLIIFLCAASAAAATFPLTGTVTGLAGPLAGARIQIFTAALNNPSTSTDAQGRFSIDAPAGNVTLRISGPEGSGLADDYLQNLDMSEALDGRFTLAKAVTISGRCMPDDPSTPGINVDLYSVTTLRNYHVNGPTFEL